jgi:hypothetical protein
LVGLCALAAVEARWFDKRTESLRSFSRAALPLMGQAIRSTPGETTNALSDYGLAPRPDLQHVCGRYELLKNGRLRTWDFFTGQTALQQLRKEIDQELVRGTEAGNRTRTRADVSIRIDAGADFKWPRNCLKTAGPKAQSVLVASRIL